MFANYLVESGRTNGTGFKQKLVDVVGDFMYKTPTARISELFGIERQAHNTFPDDGYAPTGDTIDGEHRISDKNG